MPDALSPSSAKILVVEDDPAVSSAVCTLLNHYEFNAIVARTLNEARNQLANKPDLVILDLGLPDGDGLDLLERIRRINCPARVIVLTATVDPDNTRRIARLKPNRFFHKPLNFFQLLDGIRSEIESMTTPGSTSQATLI